MDFNHEEANPNNKKHLQKSKWPILIYSSLLLMGDYYAFDVPFAIKEELKTKFTNIISLDDFNSSFNLLYTVYIIPNIFLPFLNAIFTERVMKI